MKIQQADKGSYVVVWDSDDYLTKGYRELNHKSTCIEVKNFNEKLVWLKKVPNSEKIVQ